MTCDYTRLSRVTFKQSIKDSLCSHLVLYTWGCCKGTSLEEYCKIKCVRLKSMNSQLLVVCYDALGHRVVELPVVLQQLWFVSRLQSVPVHWWRKRKLSFGTALWMVLCYCNLCCGLLFYGSECCRSFLSWTVTRWTFSQSANTAVTQPYV